MASTKKRGLIHTSSRISNVYSNDEDLAPVHETGSHTWWGKLIERFVMNPNNFFRMMWDLLGCFMFCYDAIAIPLQFFDPPEHLFSIIMTWLVRIYWTCDIPISMLT